MGATLPSSPPAPSVVALVVPFREQHDQDRRAQLVAFERHMTSFLQASGSDDKSWQYILVIVEQAADGRPFNRGQLLNVGFREAQRHLTPAALVSVILHDVDLLPSRGLLRWYCEPPAAGRPCHIAGPSTWKKYAVSAEYSARFFGGVTALHPADFERANGFPNDYWGWGMEDDQLRLRVDASQGLANGVERPPEGAGRYDDIDPIKMGDRIRHERKVSMPDVRGWDNTVVERFNPKMWDMTSRQRLDDAWRTTNGLKGLVYDVQQRDERELAGRRVVRIHVLAKLMSGYDCEYVERALHALRSAERGLQS